MIPNVFSLFRIGPHPLLAGRRDSSSEDDEESQSEDGLSNSDPPPEDSEPPAALPTAPAPTAEPATAKDGVEATANKEDDQVKGPSAKDKKKEEEEEKRKKKEKKEKKGDGKDKDRKDHKEDKGEKEKKKKEKKRKAKEDDKDRGRSRSRKKDKSKSREHEREVRRPKSPPNPPSGHQDVNRNTVPDPGRDRESGQRCSICWKWIRGSMAQHQATSTACREWQQKNTSGSTEWQEKNASGSKRDQGEATRQTCKICNKSLCGSLWSLWQHFQSCHPNRVHELEDVVPKEWQTWSRDNHRGRGRSQSSACRPLDRSQSFAKRPDFQNVKEEQPSDKEDEHNDRHREDDPDHQLDDDDKNPRLRGNRHRRRSRRSRSRRQHSSRRRRLKSKNKDANSSPVPDTAHQPLGGSGPRGPPPGPGGAPSSSGQSAVATLLINIGAALALEQAK